MHDEEQKRSVLVESYRKLRSVKKPKLQVSLLICNLIKRLEKTFTKTPPLQQEQDHEHVQYYQPLPPPPLPPPPPPPLPHHHHHQYHRTTYRSSSSDSIYMSPLENDQQYSSEKLFSPMNDFRSTMYQSASSTTDAYWLAQSNFAVPVVSTVDDDDDQIDESLHGDRDYLDLSDHTLSSTTDCCCSSTSSSSKILVDTNNNSNDDYYLYHHSTSTSTITEPTTSYFYPHNLTNTVDLITTA